MLKLIVILSIPAKYVALRRRFVKHDESFAVIIKSRSCKKFAWFDISKHSHVQFRLVTVESLLFGWPGNDVNSDRASISSSPMQTTKQMEFCFSVVFLRIFKLHMHSVL